VRALLLALLVFSTSFGVSGLPASAQSFEDDLGGGAGLSQVRLEARAGFDGEGRLGTWIPVEIELINQGAEVRGEIQVALPSPPLNQLRPPTASAPTLYTLPVVLPRLSHKRFVVEVNLPSQTNRLTAKLVRSGSTQVLAEREISMARVPLGDYFCGVLARDPAAYDFLGALELPPPIRRIRTAALEPASLPHRAQLMGSFDCLIVDNTPTSQLTAEQIGALKVWVATGGLLITVGGSTWQSTLSGLPPDLLPVEPIGLQSVPDLQVLGTTFEESLEVPGPWLVTQSRLRADRPGNVAISQNGLPLVVGAKHGDGTVLFVAFEPTARALKGWAGGEKFWRYLLTHASVENSGGSALVRPYLRWGNAPRLAMNDFAEHERPNLSWLWSLTMGYAGIAAITLFVLTRRGMVGWAVVSVIGLTVGTTLISLQQATTRSDSDLAATRVSVIRPVGGSETNAGYTREYLSILTKKTGTFDIELTDGSLPRSLYFPSPRPQDESDLGWVLKVGQGGHPSLKGMELKQGSLVTAVVDGQLNQTPDVRADLKVDQGYITGTITNRTGSRISNAMLLVEEEPLVLGTMERDEVRELNGTVLPRQAFIGTTTPQNLAAKILGDYRGPDLATRRSVLESLFFDRQFTRRLEFRGPTFVGWLDDAPTKLTSPGLKAAVTDTALLVQGVQIALPRGFDGEIPAAAMNRRSLTPGNSQQPGDRDISTYSVQAGEAMTMQFSLPPTQGRFQLQQLRVNLEGRLVMRQIRAPQAPFNVSLFNWKAGDWQPWELKAGANIIPDGDRYVSAAGDIRARFTIESGQGGTIRDAQFSRLDITALGAVR
jgi:hypothetical protein